MNIFFKYSFTGIFPSWYIYFSKKLQLLMVMTMNADVMRALAEPHRLKIVELLRERPLTVGEIAERLQLHQPQASKHLRVLGEAGIVVAHVDANCRIYRLRPDPFRELDGGLPCHVGGAVRTPG